MFLCASGEDQPGKQVTIMLGGPRRIVAEISESRGLLDVKVSFVAVRAFDDATNRLISQEKSLSYAMHALKAYLAPDKSFARIMLSGQEIVDSRMNGGLFTVRLRVARDGVQVDLQELSSTDSQRPAQFAAKESPIRAVGSNLFTIKSDYLETAETLKSTLAVKTPPVPDSGNLREFYRAVATLEQEAETAFARLRTDFEADELVLQHEKEELASAITEVEAALMAALRRQVEKSEANR